MELEAATAVRPLTYHAPAYRKILKSWLSEAALSVPVVILGLMLNLLDAISYGLIIFPVAHPIFDGFGPIGISMFLLSTCLAQMVYSGGFSIFKGCNGSMMIEGKHDIYTYTYEYAEIIIDQVGHQNQHAIIATVMVAYALSTILTGILFVFLGAFKLGSLVGFFPRHILIGTIGGVGYFLMQTGLEVTSRINFEWKHEILEQLFTLPVLGLWGSSLAGAILLQMLQYRIHHPLFVPCYFLVIPVVFYIVVAMGGWSLVYLRDIGWLFALPQPAVPFYDFWMQFDFSATVWSALPATLPTMLSLTFFGILHVPINVPALGVSTGEDNVDTNRELIAHGVSNLAAGFTGTIQNYLVYSNSVLFMKSGGDSRLAGLLLAAATFAVFLAGPQIVGFIPVVVVGSLIFHLGMELMREALWDTWSVLQPIEYATIVTIVAAMALFGFTEGILLGIILACVFFVVTYSRRNSVRAVYSGAQLKSRVRRPYRQLRFLEHVGDQIRIVKLQGFLFFGTIGAVEKLVRSILTPVTPEPVPSSSQTILGMSQPIRFLVLDFHLVTGIDFSAAEAFLRLKRLLVASNIYLVISGVTAEAEMVRALRTTGVWTGAPDETWVHGFVTLNGALEWCENSLLEAYYYRRQQRLQQRRQQQRQEQEDEYEEDEESNKVSLIINVHIYLSIYTIDMIHNSSFIIKTEEIIHEEIEPLIFLKQIFHGMPYCTDDVLARLSCYLEQQQVPAGQTLWHKGEPAEALYLVEQGVLHLLTETPLLIHSSRIIPGTMIGELELITESIHTSTLVTDTDVTLWRLTRVQYQLAMEQEPGLMLILARIALSYAKQNVAGVVSNGDPLNYSAYTIPAPIAP
ncbi:sulfate transporter family-domain-containing protein [Syncephalis plumigaleata]|nr:sulfate transporter family-domain-containing protein [Syncephalis plumigaleata]